MNLSSLERDTNSIAISTVPLPTIHGGKREAANGYTMPLKKQIC
jgi:hypothetical protein